MRLYPSRIVLYGCSFLVGFLIGAVYLINHDLYPGDGHAYTVKAPRAPVVQPFSTSLLHLRTTASDATRPAIPTGKPSNTSSSSPDDAAHNGCPKILRLFFVVMSSPFGASRRSAIRRSWLQLYQRSPDIDVTTKFIIGTKNLIEKKYHQIMNESKLYRDILFLDELEDSYHNLTWKVLRTLTMARHQMDFHFLVKLDDDSFVQVNKLVGALRKMDCPNRLFMGYFMGYATPELSGKWLETHWFICPNYLPYAMGGGYVLSRKLVQLVTHFGNKLTLYHNEDVSMGTWIAPYDIERVHEIRFNTEASSRGCNNNYIITHKEKAASFLRKRKSMLLNGTLCSVEKDNFPGYMYNWTVPPTQCCERKKGISIPSS